MSKFAYKAEGELNSQYLLELLKEYLSKLLACNDTNGIVEDDYKINTNANSFVKWFKDSSKRLFKSKESLENYNKVLSTKYIKAILDKVDIFLQSNALSARQVFELTQTLQAIHFNDVIPALEEYRERAIKSNQKRFLKVINDIKYLKYASSDYILYNSPVEDLKPFLTDKVSVHTIDYTQLQKLVRQFVTVRYNELNAFDFEPYEVEFISKKEDFYKDSITDNGIGEEVEAFIRSKMLEKLEISKQEEILPEELNAQIAQIDILLKRLKLGKIEKKLQELITIKTNIAHVKEVIDKCKDEINNSTIPNKAQIFLVMDNLYYKLSKKCEVLQQKIKLKLQLVDKQKMFAMLENIQAQSKYNKIDKAFDEEHNLSLNHQEDTDSSLNEINLNKLNQTDEDNQSAKKSNIASNLYDDDEDGEIHISEDDEGIDAEDEIIIDEDK